MQLRSARLCLDCDEVHGERECPVCASERFAFLTKWVPAEERRQRARPVDPPRSTEAPADPSSLRWAKRGAAGLALLAVSRWLWQQSKNDGRQRDPDAAASATRPPDTNQRAES